MNRNVEIRERLSTKISYFLSVYSRENDRVIPLKTFFKTIATGTYKQQVSTVAIEQDKKVRSNLKTLLLPAVTIAGQFKPVRNTHNLIDHSGVIAIDIDPPSGLSDKQQYEFAVKIKSKLTDDKFIMAMHYTASYRGIVAYFAIPFYTDNTSTEVNSIYSQYYTSISGYLYDKYDIISDSAPKSIASLRFYSYDSGLIVNLDCKIYSIDINVSIVSKHFPEAQEATVSDRESVNGGTSIIALITLANNLIEANVDITVRYATWLRIAFGIVTSFGEEGRDSFHRISSVYRAYKFSETDKLYNYALKTSSGKVTVATVFKLAFDAGINYGRYD